MSRLLQITGAAALLAWTGLGLFAWMQVGSGLQVTLSEQAHSEQAERDALVDDRLRALGGDVDALVHSLEENLGALVATLEDESRANEQRGMRLDERLRRLEEALPAARRAQETAAALEDLVARLEASRSSPLERLPDAVPADPFDVDPRPDPAQDASPPPGPAALPIAETAEAPEPARSFLAFRLPDRDFRFAGRQTFELLPELSRVGFDAESTLHDFTGVSNAVEGSFALDLADPAAGIEGEVRIETSSLGTGIDGRDEGMLANLGAEQHRRILFAPRDFRASVSDPDARRVSGAITGDLSLRGVTREVTMEVRAHVDEARRLVVEGEMPLQLEDYGVPVPNQLGVVSMDPEVRVWIFLRARARRAAPAGER